MKQRPARRPSRGRALKSNIPVTVEQDARTARRKFAETVVSKIEAGEPLGKYDLQSVADILRTILAGLDAGKHLGIAPKRGTSQSNGQLHRYMAAHYWLTRDIEPKEVAAATHVADFWGGCNLSTVRRAAKEHKEFYESMCISFTPAQILAAVQLCVQVHHIRPNPGN